MSRSKFVIIAGGLGSGKSTLTESLVERCDAESRNVGDELANIYRRMHGIPSSEQVAGLQRMQIHKLVRDSDPNYFIDLLSMPSRHSLCVIDGLRNMSDALGLVKQHDARVISLVAPRAIRFSRRLGIDTAKDPDIQSMVEREISELNDRDLDGAQTIEVMAMAQEHGIFIDARKPANEVFDQAVEYLGVPVLTSS